jgi:hypothetical protein
MPLIQRTSSLLLLALLVASGSACYSAVNNGGSATSDDGGVSGDDAAAPEDPPDSLFDGPTTCTSGTKWTGGDSESPYMHPGGECVSCHSQNGGPKLLVGGSVFATGHEPVDCNGVKPGSNSITVTLTSADGTTHDLPVNSAGNFYLYARGNSLNTPFTAKITRGDKSYEMHGEQTTGDCNSCHTVDGANGARGRIVAP